MERPNWKTAKGGKLWNSSASLMLGKSWARDLLVKSKDASINGRDKLSLWRKLALTRRNRGRELNMKSRWASEAVLNRGEYRIDAFLDILASFIVSVIRKNVRERAAYNDKGLRKKKEKNFFEALSLRNCSGGYTWSVSPSLWRMANARNVIFTICPRWPILIW